MYEDQDDEKQVDIKKLKYVLYTRKSTDDPKRQIRSTNDQKTECKQLAERLGIRIVKTIKEDRSAKKPGNRPFFDDMMTGIESGKYDAILAWNPDRLARNMPEGSNIMALLDNSKIKDLKFVTHYFTNNASGKMLLGISFVMADYYSQNLSENVSRGVRRGFSEGKSSGRPIHGYVRGEDGIYRPDNENGSKNFDLICAAWHMRKTGKSLEVIAEYMNTNGYARVYKEGAEKAGKKVLMTYKILSDRVFPNPFYYGILIQKNKRIDLRDIAGYNFQPATGEETYNAIQAMTGRRAPSERRRVEVKPLVQMVICAYCQKPMIPQAPQSGRKSKERILSYRCDTSYCPRRKDKLDLAKSVRANVVFDFMATSLDNLHVTKDDYNKVLTKLDHANQTKIQTATMELHSKQGALKAIERDIKDRSLKIINMPQDSPIYRTNEAHINTLEVNRQQLEDDISKLQQRRTDPQQDLISFDDFLNVANNASRLLRAANGVVKDRVARFIYLNVTVDDQNVVDYQMKEPFNTLLKTQKILDGRGERT